MNRPSPVRLAKPVRSAQGTDDSVMRSNSFCWGSVSADFSANGSRPPSPVLELGMEGLLSRWAYWSRPVASEGTS
jgi:hypothetical protein